MRFLFKTVILCGVQNCNSEYNKHISVLYITYEPDRLLYIDQEFVLQAENITSVIPSFNNILHMPMSFRKQI